MERAASAALSYGKTALFFFFSNRLGCGGSIAVSAVLTLLILFLFGVIGR